MRTSSVVPPLQATSRHRTERIRRASASDDSTGSVSSGIGHPVADAADRLDPAAGVTELGPQVVDIGVDGIRGDRHAEGPRLVEQLVAAQALAGMPEEALQQGKLARAQLDRPTLDRHPAGLLAEPDRPDGDDRVGPAGAALRTSGEGPEARRELLEREGLHE